MEYEVSVPKGNEVIKYKVISIYHSKDDYYELKVVNKDGKTMGKLTYAIKYGNWNRSAWLNKIETKKEFQHQGVGTALIKVFEYELVKARVTFIDGKFYPDNEYAKPFYEKHGYSIDRDWNDVSVCKSLYLEPEEVEELEKMVKPIDKNIER